MSTTTSRYADYGSACPRCQQIINTIDITFQQGIFIYDLTFIQQELESVLIAAIERQNQLLENDNDNLTLPLSSMIRLPNGKKPRDFKAERERRRKALSGHVSRKRRIKKSSTIQLLKTSNENNFILSTKKRQHSETNGNSLRSSMRSYRSMNFTFSDHYEVNHPHPLSTNKFQINTIINPDQFWSKILDNQHEFLKPNDYNSIKKLIEIDQSLLDNFDYEKEYNQYKQFINSKEYLLSLSEEKYIHPELEYSIVLKQNLHLYNFVNKILNNKKRKRKYSMISNNHDSIQIDDSILNLLQRDNKNFSSKYAELQHRLAESISLERLALNRAEEQDKLDKILVELNEIDDKILEITNSIRQRKRPSENAISLCKSISPIINNHHQNGNNESEAWRKGRRQSTLRVYDELARLIDERMEYEKQIIDINPSIQF